MSCTVLVEPRYAPTPETEPLQDACRHGAAEDSCRRCMTCTPPFPPISMLEEFARHGVLGVQSKRLISHNSASEIQYPNIEIGGKGGGGVIFCYGTVTVHSPLQADGATH